MAPVVMWPWPKIYQTANIKLQAAPGYFVLTGAAAVGIAWMMVGYRAVRAAQANPAGALIAE